MVLSEAAEISDISKSLCSIYSQSSNNILVLTSVTNYPNNISDKTLNNPKNNSEQVT